MTNHKRIERNRRSQESLRPEYREYPGNRSGQCRYLAAKSLPLLPVSLSAHARPNSCACFGAWILRKIGMRDERQTKYDVNILRWRGLWVKVLCANSKRRRPWWPLLQVSSLTPPSRRDQTQMRKWLAVGRGERRPSLQQIEAKKRNTYAEGGLLSFYQCPVSRYSPPPRHNLPEHTRRCRSSFFLLGTSSSSRAHRHGAHNQLKRGEQWDDPSLPPPPASSNRFACTCRYFLR